MPPKRRRAPPSARPPAPNAPEAIESVRDIVDITSAPESRAVRDTSPVVVTGSGVAAARRRTAGSRTRGGGASIRQSPRSSRDLEAELAASPQPSVESQDEGTRGGKRRRTQDSVPLHYKDTNKRSVSPKDQYEDDEGSVYESDDDSDDDSDVAWEDVDLGAKRRFLKFAIDAHS